MTVNEALDILRPEKESFDSLKKAYHELIKRYHPDLNPDGLKFTQLITEAYDFICKVIAEKEKRGLKFEWSKPSGSVSVILGEMQEALNKLKKCKGLNVEICGTFLWVSGETKYWKEYLKAEPSKFWWSSHKSEWYWKPSTYRKYDKRVWTKDQIRMRFGSKKWNGNEFDENYVN